MKSRETTNFFENFDKEKLSKMLDRAWEIADDKFIKKYGKTFEKLYARDAKEIALQVLDEFGVASTEPVKMEYSTDLIKALQNGDKNILQYGGIKEGPKTPENPTAQEDIGYFTPEK